MYTSLVMAFFLLFCPCMQANSVPLGGIPLVFDSGAWCRTDGLVPLSNVTTGGSLESHRYLPKASRWPVCRGLPLIGARELHALPSVAHQRDTAVLRVSLKGYAKVGLSHVRRFGLLECVNVLRI